MLIIFIISFSLIFYIDIHVLEVTRSIYYISIENLRKEKIHFYIALPVPDTVKINMASLTANAND